MHTNPCANMETHWPVHLKRDPRPTHFEREAGPYALSTRRPRFAGTLRACKCTLSAGRSEREYMTESCRSPASKARQSCRPQAYAECNTAAVIRGAPSAAGGEQHADTQADPAHRTPHTSLLTCKGL